MKLSTKKFYILGGVIIALLFLLILLVIPQWQSKAYRANFPPEVIEKLTPQERINLEKNAADIENSTRLTIAQIVGGLALLAGLYFTYQNVKTAQDNLRITEQGKLTERFSKAVELLGSDKLDIRLGGIYALERIARDSNKDHWTVMEVLTAFIRENAPYIPNQEEKTPEEEIPKPREDIQAIMTVIGRRKWSDMERQVLNLQEVDLAGCVLVDANLNKANLWHSNLYCAKMVGANLNSAYLSFANLELASLNSANMEYANFHSASLIRANLHSANLSRAKLIQTNLTHANLSDADLREANLKMAQFITLEQLLSARFFEEALLSPRLEKELKEWQAKQAKENLE